MGVKLPVNRPTRNHEDQKVDNQCGVFTQGCPILSDISNQADQRDGYEDLSRTNNQQLVSSDQQMAGIKTLDRKFSDALAINFQSKNLPTPIDVPKLDRLLSGYGEMEKRRLVDGFTRGFTIPSTISSDPCKFGYTNHKTVLSNMSVVQDKLDKELRLGRIAGPFVDPPFENFIVSPLGLVPKKNPGEFRLIHDLSFPKGNSVNSHIDPQFSTVQYEVLDHCIEIIQSLGSGCLVAKADLRDAFRIIPVSPASYRMLGFFWKGRLFYDKCLPMGCSISCQTFELLSQALQWIMIHKLSVQFTSHILDDFIFFGYPESNQCRSFLNTFLALAEEVNLPVKHSKTVQPSTSVVLHGILVDTRSLQMSLPDDKVREAREMVDAMSRRKKVQLRSLQSLIGVLNFACRVVVPGRAFLRRLINLTLGVRHPLHFIKLTAEARKDLEAWRVFLHSFNGKTLCLPNRWTSSNSVRLFTDASGFGYAAIFGKAWFQGKFPAHWMEVNIAVKELLPIVLSVKLWGAKMANSRILFMTDNESVVHIINSQTSRDNALMCLVRSLVVSTMTFNIEMRAKHIPGKLNVIADALSRFQMLKVFEDAPWLNKVPESVPDSWLPWNSRL